MKCGFVVPALALALSCPRSVRAGDGEAAAQAFRAGVQHAQVGELDAAVREFQEAYRISPNYVVLYNLGQSLALMGQPVEAVDALKRYLKEGGAAVDEGRRRAVEDTIAFYTKRIGSLEVSVLPGNASLEIDGRAAPDMWQREGVRLASGRHTVVVKATGYRSQVQSVLVAPTELVKLAIRLELEPTLEQLAQLQITCDTPGVDVKVDGHEVGRTPVAAPLLLTRGRHSVQFERSGYTASERALELSGDGVQTTSCDVRPSAVAMTQAGELWVQVSEPQSRVLLDGQAFLGGMVPSGDHLLEVRRAGFQAWTKRVYVAPGSRTRLDAQLQAEPEYAADQVAHVRRQRNLAFVLGGAGLMATGAAVGLWVATANQHAHWEDERDALAGATSPESAVELLGQLHERGLRVQRLNAWALGSTLAAGALFSAGAAVYFTAGDPNRYGTLHVQLAASSISTTFKGVW